MIISEASYNLTDPTIDSQVIDLKASGADIFFMATSPNFSAQAIRRTYELNWKPLRILDEAGDGDSRYPDRCRDLIHCDPGREHAVALPQEESSGRLPGGELGSRGSSLRSLEENGH